MSPPLDHDWVRRSFERAADTYEAAAALQREVEQRLLERLDLMSLVPDRVLDLGCGLGRSTQALAGRYPAAEVIAVDLSLPMLRAGCARPAVCGDARRLPLPDACCDLVYSNLMLQWCDDPLVAFDELRRVLRPRGLLLFTTFGPGTLAELRHAWQQVDQATHVNEFLDMHHLGDVMIEAGFDDAVVDVERMTVRHRSVLGLMRDLKAIGAHNVTQGRPRALTGKQRLRQMMAAYEQAFADGDGNVPASYEVVYGHALGPPPGRPHRREGMEVATFSPDHLRGSRRQR